MDSYTKNELKSFPLIETIATLLKPLPFHIKS